MLRVTAVSWGLGLSLACAGLSACAQSALQPTQIASTGLSREQAQQVLLVALKHQDYPMSKPGVFVDGDLQDESGKPLIRGTSISAWATTIPRPVPPSTGACSR